MSAAPSENDLQELLRLLTTSRKLSILQAMGQVKALQAVNLRSIQQIAEAPLETVQAAVKDANGAKALQNSCKTALKKKTSGTGTGGKRAASSGGTSEPAGAAAAKRAKTQQQDGDLLFGAAPMTPAELEQSLELPVFVPESDEDEARMASTVLQTNRAPLVLAFAVELLRYTMPEQPLSSRLSLAQAVVSANSRSKAGSLGMAWARGPSADDEGWGAGQPRVRILGREVAVLKRGGYTWKGDEEETDDNSASAEEKRQGAGGGSEETADQAPNDGEESTQGTLPASSNTQTSTQQAAGAHYSQPAAGTWSVSQTISLKGSTFVARATTMTDQGQRAALLRALMEKTPQLLTATHNAWAYRVRGSGSSDYAQNVRQDSYDDGETGCGDLMLRVLRELGAVDTLVVLTRWFGGVLLGPDRWRLMRNCVTGALAERMRRTGAEVALGGEAAWGLDLEAMREQQQGGGGGGGGGGDYKNRYGAGSSLTSVVGMPIHRPEGARQYLLKSFATFEGAAAAPADATDAAAAASPTTKKKKKTIKALDAEKAENLGLLLGALRLVYDSWADHLPAAELDRRAWSWYVAVRPDVDVGPSGWGAKGALKLKDILALRRPET